jgi:Uma2 family endonuclease
MREISMPGLGRSSAGRSDITREKGDNDWKWTDRGLKLGSKRLYTRSRPARYPNPHMAEPAHAPKLTVEDYLEGEKLSEVRHEYVNGEIFAMTGASKVHNRLTRRLTRLFEDALDGKPYEAFATDVKVRVRTQAEDRFYYPDLHVECEPSSPAAYFSEHPVLVLEVLSKTTERTDRSDKFYAYRKLTSLMEYVLVAQDEARVEVYRKATGWDLEVYGVGQRFRLDSIDAELGVDEIYRSIDLSASD